MKNLFFFDKMLAPKLITLIYWVLLLVAVVNGVYTIFGSYYFHPTDVVFGILQIAGGVIGARIWCELMIVIFKINSNLQKIADKK
ncbi:DUF4282 domain-containing protein [Vibrio intestinalis]|uniref:DUF4282 domain-containing protein n=1 Tax=Vibrio intestinalis TaxID=2933291 RepID=UPI0021A3995D|nr:DUF4282 domain-containing protein [Vibrio intestinalis]